MARRSAVMLRASRANDGRRTQHARASVGDATQSHGHANRRKRGTAEVDAEFLKEIEDWREVLARNLASRSPRLSVREWFYRADERYNSGLFHFEVEKV